MHGVRSSVNTTKTVKMIQTGGTPLLSIKGLTTEFQAREGKVLRALDGFDLAIDAGEIHGLVGESGCGKTVASHSIMRLSTPPGAVTAGEVWWKDRELLALNRKEMVKIRGKEIAMIFQDPRGALNPLYTIGSQMATVIRLHGRFSKNEARREAQRLLKEVKIADPGSRMNDHPHQLSGGMCQRVMIAMALSCQPDLLIADEPTAALDVTIQGQILDLLLELRERFNMAILLISHDMGVVARMCDRISVMYLGKIIENAGARELYGAPGHPYTRALLEAIPTPDPEAKRRFSSLEGDPPSALHIPGGCRFRPRCARAFDRCTHEPPMQALGSQGAKAACWLHEKRGTE